MQEVLKASKENVMKEKNKTPKEWISIRVKPEEYTIIYGFFTSTTCRKLSEYVRKVLLHKPVTVNYRNQSADEVLSALNQLKKELLLLLTIMKETWRNVPR